MPIRCAALTLTAAIAVFSACGLIFSAAGDELVHAVDAADERGLPAPRGAHDGGGLPLGYGKINVVENGMLSEVGGKCPDA